MECKCGHLHASAFSDVLIRRPYDFSLAEKGEKGLIEVVSVLPGSYPGHVLLTEDEGMILGEDDCEETAAEEPAADESVAEDVQEQTEE